MALPETGLVVQTYDEVLSTIVAEEQSRVSSSIDVSDDTALGQLNKIMSLQVSQANELLQDVYDQRSINHAEGKALDDLVTMLGLRRLQAAATHGLQFFSGTEGISLPSNTVVQNDSTKENYSLDTTLVLTRSACYNATIEGKTYTDGVTYGVTVQGSIYEYSSVNGDTMETVLLDITNQINTAAVDYAAVYSTDNESVLIESTDTDYTQTLLVSTTVDLRIIDVTCKGAITGLNVGVLPATAHSITKIISSLSGFKATYNPAQLIVGRDIESDTELRSRAIQFTASTGTATVESIIANVRNLEGVSSANVAERYVSEYTDSWKLVIDEPVSASTQYIIAIQDDTYSYTSDATATAIEIAAGLKSDIDGTNTRAYSVVDNLDGSLTVSSSSLYTLAIVSIGAGGISVHDGQPAGSFQLVVSGGDDDEIAQALWDAKPAGVQVWATGGGISGSTYTEGTAISEATGTSKTLPFNRPILVPIQTQIHYEIFDETAFPDDKPAAELAMKQALVDFGLLLNAGESVVSDEFEASVYCASSGIYKLIIKMSGNGVSMAESVTIPMGSSEEAFFDIASVAVFDDT